jgi:catalase
MSPAQQQALFENTARSLGGAPKEIQIRHIGNCAKADPAYGKGIADALGLAATDLPEGDFETTTLRRAEAHAERVGKEAVS